jgi:DNA-binding NarL/FixJ family response regulator
VISRKGGWLVMTKIVLVDDHQMMRDGLRLLLEKEPGVRIVGDADNGRNAVQLVKDLSPDVVVMDIGLPGLNGIEATRQIMAASPKTSVIALSMHSDKRYVIQMLRAGAKAYLLKNCASDELMKAIRSVQSNLPFVSQGIAQTLVDHVVRDVASTGTAYTDLTPREREVLQLLSEGMKSKEIACELHISIKTVETYRRDIMSKLDLHSIAELTKYAIREGLIALDE